MSLFARAGTLAAAALALSACSSLPWWGLYRFDDRLSEAEVAAIDAPSALTEAEELLWEFDEQVVTWRPVSGKMGFRSGELVVKGEGRYPVITSPERPEIDWALYKSLLIRMRTAGGSTIKVKFEHQELSQELAPPMEPRLYRFDIDLQTPSFTGRLDILPTDSPDQAVAIDWIRLVPRQTTFPDPAGVRFVGKASEYRRAIYAHSPSAIGYDVSVPRGASLNLGLGIVEADRGVRFRVRAGAGGDILYAGELSDASAWKDERVDLAAYEGRTLRLVFETDAAEGVVGLWANPTLTSNAPKRRPNVLLYLIDTLRPDHTSLYGYGRDTTPFLSELGAEGVVFDDCHVQATWTKPSVASILTSLHTATHGLNEMVDVIPPGATTLAEVLRKAGYVTATVTGNPFSGRNSGLDRGVDYLFEYPAVNRQRAGEDEATDSEALNRTIFPWLERHRDEPFFLFVHSTDPHAPYRPPPDMLERFGDPAEDEPFQSDSKRMRPQLRRYGGSAIFNRAQSTELGVDPDLWVRRALDRYDGEIAHNDRAIQRLVEKLDKLGLRDDTLIVVMSDHGEEFLEHGWTAHGHTLYEELTRGLLLIWNPKRLPTPRRVRQTTQTIDVMPTVLSLLGIESDAVIQGNSLEAEARGLPSEREAAAMASRLSKSGVPPPDGGVPENWTGTTAWIGPQWKLIYRDQAARTGLSEVELYDRVADPGDRSSLAMDRPEVAARLTARVREWLAAQAELKELLGREEPSELDQETIERLRSLGYLAGAAAEMEQ